MKNNNLLVLNKEIEIKLKELQQKNSYSVDTMLDMLLRCDIREYLQNIIIEALSFYDVPNSQSIINQKMVTTYDLGFSISSSKKLKNNIYGVIPYVAPEILQGKSYLQVSDILL
ncbi:hypothetical protein C2G38_2178642 [Gigaspora rosea]|uniref:Protein kinase domain-containing protein n=1 Tax=Gigaspora rosea TaxID=44941 RepID=A0A397VE07_9GLOM|nr:hypothetical protein C2G38_2178642 [Gigaspora rosea]